MGSLVSKSCSFSRLFDWDGSCFLQVTRLRLFQLIVSHYQSLLGHSPPVRKVPNFPIKLGGCKCSSTRKLLYDDVTTVFGDEFFM